MAAGTPWAPPSRPRAGWTRRRPVRKNGRPWWTSRPSTCIRRSSPPRRRAAGGDSEAWVFRTDEEVEPDRVPALLPTLPMGCVEGLGTTGRFEIARRPADEIWSLLFATASVGSRGAHGAFGRLWAWKSLAALSDTPADASAEEVEHHVRRTTWFHFESDAEWFCNDAFTDYGIAALSPDRRRIAVLAATDTV
ncbi:DUF6183 family protein [Streptomyces parvus]|uniref:DUF6183 family protein n=1 Tax=Streptomyces parvus TaxID=66428 RepID=UPI0035DEFD7D